MSNSIPNRAILKENKIWLLIDSRDVQATKNVCTLVNCRYHIRDGMYDLPLTFCNTQILIEWKFEFGKSLRDWEREKREEQDIKRVQIKSIPGFNATLRPFQARGVEFIDEVDGRALIADDMGLGKTIQGLAWCAIHTEKRPVLVVCPANIKINWMREIVDRLGIDKSKVQILEGRTPSEIYGEFVIINYDVLDWWVKDLKSHGFQALIADESHHIRNSTSKRTKAFKRLAKYFETIIAMTGTPIENYPVEIYNIVNILNPKIFPNYYQFTQRFCAGKPDGFGRNVKGVSNPEELYRILTKTVMIRRKKSDVLKELPPKQICVMPLEITNRKEYQLAENQLIEFIKKKFGEDLGNEGIDKELKAYAKLHDIEVGDELDANDLNAIKDMKVEKANNAPILVQMNHLKQLAVKGKMEATIEWIEDFLESEEKLVVFAINKIVITELINKFPDAMRIDGSVSMKNRQKAIDTFQNDVTCKLFILNIDAGGVGITLTAASNVLMLQFPWTPGKYVQAIDRLHRMTQTKKVMVWNAIACDTIEEKILKVLSLKEQIITDVLDGGKHDVSSVASEVIKMYKIK
jgi:SWI/SNF-related matrix-associated actin-dependent regulator 1 of chromatin subfamily A